jgi:hypothetical protein
MTLARAKACGGKYAKLMHTVTAHSLEPDQIQDIALYYASLSSDR